MKYIFAIRPVQASDVEAILSILREVACQIPVKLSTREHVNAMKAQIVNHYLDDLSLVAVNENGVVVGFQLAKKLLAKNDRCADEPYIHLAYAGVTAATAGKKVFRLLIEAEKRHRLPLVTEVKTENKSDMAARLRGYNFRPYFSFNITGNYRWDPE